MGRPIKRKKEEIAEGFCFFCKDGGLLRICDYKNCLKGYHPQCVQRDDSFLETNERWWCGWHYCFLCGKSAKFHCFGCPIAVCGRCLCDSEFAIVRGKYGFCNNCLELALLLEDKNPAVSDKKTVNFDDKETYEFFFKSYWEDIRKREGLNLEHLRSAHGLLKNSKNYNSGSDGSESYGREDDEESQVETYDSSSDQTNMGIKKIHKRKRSDRRLFENAKQRKANSKKQEFLGWASRSLLYFLQSIGKDTSKELSQFDVAAIITEYCKEQKLFHPEKRKKINCDERLTLLLGRKSVNKNGIYKLLQVHFAENFEESEEESGGSSRENNKDLVCSLEHQNTISDQRSKEKDRQSCFALVVPGNIKLIYLKRSLVVELTKQLDTFEGKMIGSFVRVKSDPNDCLQRNPRQLVQVTGIRRKRVDQENSEILLQVSNMLKEVSIFDLLDDDFTEEECEDLRQRVKDGLLKRPTVGEVQQKARSLHEDITKHWITEELVRLQRCIDLANHKGWRRELFEYIDKKQLLMQPSEQSRLLEEIPAVIPDTAELEAVSKSSPRKDEQGQDACTEIIFEMAPKTPRNRLQRNTLWRLHDATDDSGGKQLQPEDSMFDEPFHQSDNVPAAVEHDEADPNQISVQENQSHPMLSLSQSWPKQSSATALELEGQRTSIHQEKEQHDGNNISGNTNCQIVVHDNVKKPGGLATEVIEISDDEEHDGKVAVGKDLFDDLHSSVWYRVGTHGQLMGPYSLSLLKQWNDTRAYELQYKVFRSGQRLEDAILLTDAISQSFSMAADDQTNQAHQEQQQHGRKTASEKPADLFHEEVVGQDAEIAIRKMSEKRDQCVAVCDETWKDPNCKIWLCVSPLGYMMGPYSMMVLKEWSDTSSYGDLSYKVMRSGQKPEEAIPLADAINQFFHV